MFDVPLGSLIAITTLLFPSNFMVAEGQCLKYKEYPALTIAADAKTDDYLYGKCKDGFLLPDVRHKDYKIGDPIWIIKVKP